MENSGSAGVVTLESLLNAAPLTPEETPAAEALQDELNKQPEVLPGLEDLNDLPPLGDPKEEEEEEDEKKEVKTNDGIVLPNLEDGEPEEVIESSESKLYKDTLKSLWGDEISSISIEEDGEEKELNLSDVELDAETFADIIRSKFEAEKENVTKNKVSVEGVSEFTQALIEIDKNGGDVRSLLEVKQAYSDPLDGLDLEKPEDQAQVVYLRGLAANQNEADIKRLIKSYAEEGILEEMAQQAETELRSAVDAKIQAEMEKAENERKEREELFKAYKKDVKEVIGKKFQLKDTYKSKLVDMATKFDPEKKTYELDSKYQEWRLDPEKAAMLALLMYDQEEFVKQVSRKEVEEQKLETAKKLKIIPRSSKIVEAQKSPASNRTVHISDLK